MSTIQCSARRANRLTSLAVAMASCIAAAGCASDQTVTVHASTVLTKGLELSDLQRALQEGAINEAEYERLRRVVLRRPN